MSRTRLSLLPFFLLSLLLACTAPSWTARPWAYSDLRALDAVDAPSPAADILAVYLRRNALDFEVRVDLLDLTLADDSVLRVQIRDEQRYATHPLRITIPLQGVVQVESPFPVAPRVVRDPWSDSVTIRLNAFQLGESVSVDVAAYLPAVVAPLDEVANVRADALPPARAPLLIVFWNVFPAATPAQALRRWDGAHSGPGGGRHGLRYILENVETYKIPVVLLDLKTPQSLAAFHFLQGVNRLQRLLEKRLLILPDVAYGYGDAADVSLALSRHAAAAFDLPASAFLYAPTAGSAMSSSEQFAPLAEDTRLYRQGIPLPRRDPNAQVTVDAFTLEVRKALIEAALSPDRTDLVILGGSLPNSAWGNADVAAAVFAWIADHPWIWPLDGEALQTFPRAEGEAPVLTGNASLTAYPLYTSSGHLLSLDSETLRAILLPELRAAPENEVTRSAWQLYLSLTEPVLQERLGALRAQYLGLVADLLAAARWAEAPYEKVACDADVDYDSEPECLLTSKVFFAIVERDGARLTFLFWRDGRNVRQLVGPTAQFAQGLGDPSFWQLAHGVAADPQAILGGFVDVDSPFASYRLGTIADRSLTFLAEETGRIKVYTLREDSLEVWYHASQEVKVLLPLVFDPPSFFFGGATYQGMLTANGWRWGRTGGPQAEITASVPVAVHGFNASRPLLAAPEDPDLDYPTGHYYPFPLALTTLNGQGSFFIRLRPIP